jgi:hypothetical protein
MKKLPIDLASVYKQNYLENLGWLNKFIRLWGTTNILDSVTGKSVEVLLPRRYFFNPGLWCRTDPAVGSGCRPEFTKEEAKAKNQTWYPEYFAPYRTKRNSDGTLSKAVEDLGMEVFRFLGNDKDLINAGLKRSKVKYAWFSLNSHNLSEVNDSSVTELLNTAIRYNVVNGKVSLEISLDLNGNLLKRDITCSGRSEADDCGGGNVNALSPYITYKNSVNKDLNKLYTDYHKYFSDNWDTIVRTTIVDCAHEVPYLRPLAMYAFYESNKVTITNVKVTPVNTVRNKTYSSEVEGFYTDANVVKSVLTVGFDINTYQLDASSDGVYSKIKRAATATRGNELNTNVELIKKYLNSHYIPDDEDASSSEISAYTALINNRSATDNAVWIYDRVFRSYCMRVDWLRSGKYSNGTIEKLKKRVKVVQEALDFDYKKKKQDSNWFSAIIVIVIVIVINVYCNGCLTNSIMATLGKAGITGALATTVAYTVVLSAALNIVAVTASLLGMPQVAMGIQSFLKTVQPITILATIVYAYAAVMQKFAEERAKDVAMQQVEQNVASMGGSAFEFVPRTDFEIAVDLVSDSINSSISSFTDFSNMTFDKAIKMTDAYTKVAAQVYENYAKTEMKKLSNEIKSIEQENAELAESMEKSELSVNLLMATQNAAFNNLTNDMSKDVSMFDTPYMPAIRLGHIGNTQTTSAIALMGEAGDNYMNRYY